MCITFRKCWLWASKLLFCLLSSSNNTLYVDPVLMKFFSRTLSRAGSNSSPTSSISRGRPRDKLSSRWFLKYLWFSEVICENSRTSLLTQLKFCYWGKLLPEEEVICYEVIPLKNVSDLLKRTHASMQALHIQLDFNMIHKNMNVELLNQQMFNVSSYWTFTCNSNTKTVLKTADS